MSNEAMIDQVPPGFSLRHTLRGHSAEIARIAWSLDGQTLASSSFDKTVRIWNAETGKTLSILRGHTDLVCSVAWSPNGEVLASGSQDQTIRLWDTKTGKTLRTLKGHSGTVWSIAWSPNGEVLASGSNDQTICLWNPRTGEKLQSLKGDGSVNSVDWSPKGGILATGSIKRTVRLWDTQTWRTIRTLWGHANSILSVVCLPDGRTIATGSQDETIRIWDSKTGKLLRILEGHTDMLHCLSCSYDGRLLASKSGDGTVLLWDTSTWRALAILKEPASSTWLSGLAFHPNAFVLATLDEEDKVIRIWDLDVSTVLDTASTTLTISYANAKVVLVGDSSVGKSGLGLVLSGQSFVPTESTHGRRIWMFDKVEVKLDDGHKEIRETLLWDLAGQPGYHIIHQLHLNEVVVALVVFDAQSETDPFGGVQYWNRALRQAQNIQGDSALPLKKFLVAARMDRGGIGVSHERIQAQVNSLNFSGYFETSAKEGRNIAELHEMIRKSINWESLPKISSTQLFQYIKDFFIDVKGTGQYLSSVDNLYYLFLNSKAAPSEVGNLREQFETCIGRVESAGFIKRLSFGKLVLLQPELLDAYSSALINFVREEPDGLGSIDEERVRAGHFPIPEGERLTDRNQEQLLLIAMIEDLLRRELVLREEPFLIFPSQSTRENPDLPDPEGRAVIFEFEGPIQNIYTTLAVRLSESGLFLRKELWKNAVIYTTKLGGMYGLFLSNIGEGRGELSLFFDTIAREEMRFHFEDYVYTHLQRWALPNTIQRRRIFICPNPDCKEPMGDSQVKRRRARGLDWMTCGVCDTRVSLLDGAERLSAPVSSLVSDMDRIADSGIKRGADITKVGGKQVTKDFDVFLCHHNVDKPAIKQIGEQLKARGILPWLDEWELQPGRPWQRLLEEQIERIKSAAVFVGEEGLGPWQQQELDAFLREFVKRDLPVIPVLLASAPHEPSLPLFLRAMTWVDFRRKDPDPIEYLIWGITGKRPSMSLLG